MLIWGVVGLWLGDSMEEWRAVSGISPTFSQEPGLGSREGMSRNQTEVL